VKCTKEDRVKSAPFSALLLRIYRVQHLADEALGTQFDNLTPGQALFLYRMGDVQVPYGELHRRGLFLGANASPTVKRLESLKYLRRIHNPNDKRTFALERTARGGAIANKVAMFLRAFEENALSSDRAAAENDAAVSAALLGRFQTVLEEMGR
jgi:DNA-binding MarR family transcriptional regulator